MKTVVWLLLCACALAAAPISNLFDTGTNGPNGTDANWTVDGGPAYITDSSRFPFPFWFTQAGAVWISPQPNYDHASDPRDHTFVFATKFNLPESFVSAWIAMSIATDNALVDVRVNGIAQPIAKHLMVLPGNIASLSIIPEGTGFRSGLGPALRFMEGFRAGENVLEIYVRNSATDDTNANNPAGMMAVFDSDVQEQDPGDPVVPEPATLALAAAGLAALRFFGRKQ